MVHLTDCGRELHRTGKVVVMLNHFTGMISTQNFDLDRSEPSFQPIEWKLLLCARVFVMYSTCVVHIVYDGYCAREIDFAECL